MPIKLNANEWTKLTQHKFKTIVRLVFKLNDITVNTISISLKSYKEQTLHIAPHIRCLMLDSDLDI